MDQGRQLRLFLSDGTSSGPLFYEIVNRTIQSVKIPTISVKSLETEIWSQFQKPGVYLVRGSTSEEGDEILYIGKGEDVARRVQAHPEGLEFDVMHLLLFTSKDENLNASQVGWLESHLIKAATEVSRVQLANKNTPAYPQISIPDRSIVAEFYDDLILIAQTAGFDYFSKPKAITVKRKQNIPITDEEIASNSEVSEELPERFLLHQTRKGIKASGYPSDEGFVIEEGSLASLEANNSFKGIYAQLREKLISQEILIADKNSKHLVFAKDYVFSAPSAAASVVVGNAMNGRKAWKTQDGRELGSFL